MLNHDRMQQNERGGVMRISICTLSDLEKAFLASISSKNKPLSKIKGKRQPSRGVISQLDLWGNVHKVDNN